MMQKLSRDSEDFKILQANIDKSAQELKDIQGGDIEALRDKTKECIALLHEKELKYGLSLSSRLGMNIIKAQLKTLENACRLRKQGLSKDMIGLKEKNL